ncbi:MAG: hypothetical protein K0R36_552 [Chryseobacterium sp.]|nr:hypothetical protein [Chryseobacterium sp.]
MKTLSIKQPWASLIAHGVKNIENRTWKTNFRGRIYIHASGQITKGKYSEIIPAEYWNSLTLREQNDLIAYSNLRSAIIGEVDIIDCVINHESIWAEKSEFSPYQEDGVLNEGMKPIYNWVLKNAVLYDEPILNVKGKLSLWEFEK